MALERYDMYAPVCLALMILMLYGLGMAFLVVPLRLFGLRLFTLVASPITVILTLGSLYLCNRTDPGVLTKGSYPPDEEIEMELLTAARAGSPNWAIRISRLINDEPHRYCVTCQLWRPPRASHCRVCNHCVKRFDHHCQVIGACIGETNHRFFASLPFFGGLTIAQFFACGVARIVEILPQVGVWDKPLTYFVLFFCFFFCCGLQVLVWGTMNLCDLMTNVSTKERIFGKRRKFSLRDCSTIMCAPLVFVPCPPAKVPSSPDVYNAPANESGAGDAASEEAAVVVTVRVEGQ